MEGGGPRRGPYKHEYRHRWAGPFTPEVFRQHYPLGRVIVYEDTDYADHYVESPLHTPLTYTAEALEERFTPSEEGPSLVIQAWGAPGLAP